MSPREKKSQVTTKIAASVPGAFTTLLLAGAIVALGANAGSFTPTSDREAAVVEPGDKVDHGPQPEPDPKPEVKPRPDTKHVDQPMNELIASPTHKPKPIETAKPEQKPAEQPKPTEKAKPKPKPAPAASALALEGWLKDGKVKLGWTPFGGDGFEYYKVVRSTDATVTWPAGSGDEVIGVIGEAKSSWLAHHAPCGTAFSYAVFAVRQGGGGYQVLAVSNVVTLKAECQPQATPKETGPMGLDVQAKPGTGIKLGWTKFHGEAFAAYQVVRSQTNADPRFPANDGTEVLATIGDRYQTYFLDAAVAAGETWFYRIVAVNGAGGVLDQTDARSATAE